MKSRAFVWMAALALGVLAGCQATGPQFDARAVFKPVDLALEDVAEPNRIHPEWLQPPTDLFVLGPGDRLEIEILGEEGSRALTLVGPDGKIYYHLLPGLDVWGLTLAETKARLAEELSKYVSAPQVSLTLRGVGSKHVWLLGRLSRPGVYPLAAPMPILEAIALAGGPAVSSSQVTTEELGDLRHSFVVRQGQLLPVDFHRLLREGDTSQNIYLQADDFVFVPSALSQEVYVLGAVKTPRAVPFREQVTLVSAIASAQGTVQNAYLSHVAIVRGSLANPQISIVDYKAIVTGHAPDVALEPRDIVYIPLTPYRTLTRYLNMIVNTFVSTIAANEGSRAVSTTATPVGVSTPIGR